jgi:hypothetical protein
MLPGKRQLLVTYQFVQAPVLYRSKKPFRVEMVAVAGHTYCLRSNLRGIRDTMNPVLRNLDEHVRVWVEDLTETGGRCVRDFGPDRAADPL